MGLVKHKLELIKRGTDGAFEAQALADAEFSEAQAERESRDKFSVSLAPEDRLLLDEVKAALDIKSDSVALKFTLEAGRNAIFGTFRSESWAYLIRRSRVRASDYNKQGELKKS